MTEIALLALKGLFLALLYLFFIWLLVVASLDLKKSFRSQDSPQIKQKTALLVANVGGPQSKTISVGQQVTIGRDLTNTVTLDDSSVSAVHASIVAKDNHYVITDLGSTNGTYVNGERINGQAILHSGSEIRIGRTRLMFWYQL